MAKFYTLEFWPDEGGFVGRLREAPEVFSQGKSLSDLEANLRDAFNLLYDLPTRWMMQARRVDPPRPAG